MYIAELRGKLSERLERREDILTSNVFSFFKYANRQIFLKRLLSTLGFMVSNDEVEEAEFIFWTRYPDGTQPDLVLIVGRYYLLIEAKFLSSFQWTEEEGRSQLIREIRGGYAEASSLKKEFYLIALTADYTYRPENFTLIEGELALPQFKWINWQKICEILLQILEEESIPSTTRLFCQDLCNLLDKKNLRSFRDIKSVLAFDKLLRGVSRIFFASETATLRGDFIGFQPVLSQLPRLNKLPKRIFLRSRHFFSTLSTGNPIEPYKQPIFFNKEA